MIVPVLSLVVHYVAPLKPRFFEARVTIVKGKG